MKKIITFCFLVQVTISSFSQISHTSFPEDDTLLFRSTYLNVPFSTVDVSGQNQIWDFSNSYYSGIDSMIFAAPSAFSESTEFPLSDAVLSYRTQNHGEFWDLLSFLKSENNDITTLGGVQLISDDSYSAFSHQSSALTFFDFPMQVGNSFRDTVFSVIKVPGYLVGLPVDSGMRVRTTYRHDTIDGTGQLIVPGYTFDNVYRNKITDHYIDSNYSYTIGTGWTLFETEQDSTTMVFWHTADNFMASYLLVRQDTARTLCSPVPPPPTHRLEFANVPVQVVQNTFIPQFEVRAVKIIDNSLATSFSDTVTVYQNPQIPHSYNGFINIQAQNGVAHYSNTFFSNYGTYNLIAIAQSDTLLQDTVTITVIPAPDHLEIENLVSSPEGELLQPFQVTMYNTAGNVDLLFNGNIHIGKLTGKGKISGTTVKQAVNGVAVFDDISINYADNYNLIAWFPMSTIGQLPALDSQYVAITSNPNLNWVTHETDTLSEYVDRSQFFVWTGNADGFLSGTSREWYDEIGQHFDFSQKGAITKVVFYVASWYQVNNITNDVYKVKIYNAGVNLRDSGYTFGRLLVDSLSLELLGEQTFTENDCHPTDFFIRTPSVITFDTPVEVYSDFIVALEVNNETADDTIIIWTSVIGDGMGEHRTSRRVIENYPGFHPGWVHDNDWRPILYDVDFMIMPVIEVDTADIVTSIKYSTPERVSIYPNPSEKQLNIIADDIIRKIEITDLSGRLVFSYLPNSAAKDAVVNLEALSNGLYTAEISFTNSASVKEKLVILKP